MTLASRIAVMDNGHIRQFASPEEIYEQPIDLFVAGFIGSPPMNIVRGKVLQDSGLWIDVKDQEGSIRFPVPERLAKAASAYVGRDLQLGLRPEAITREGAAAPGPGTLAFERAVDVVEPTGPDTMLVFTMGGQEAIARVRPEDRVPEGSPFRFVANMEKAKLFDPETGTRV
jgi:multiple sugar transport system ATP-binding protein